MRSKTRNKIAVAVVLAAALFVVVGVFVTLSASAAARAQASEQVKQMHQKEVAKQHTDQLALASKLPEIYALTNIFDLSTLLSHWST
jgi:sensor domain CHASE-containing protein